MNSIKLSILLFVFLNILKFNQSASITSCYSCFWSNSSSNPLNSTLQTCGGYTVPNPTPTNSINQCQITLEYWNGNLSSINISYVLDKTTFQNSTEITSNGFIYYYYCNSDSFCNKFANILNPSNLFSLPGIYYNNYFLKFI
jgi:hypothetical protein